MSNLYIQETFENEDEGYIFGDSDLYEAFTDDVGALFRSLQKEYGRCTGKVYIDDKAGKPKQVGWHFQKRMQYEDTGRYGRKPEYYNRGVWVSVYDAPPTIVRTDHYHDLAEAS